MALSKIRFNSSADLSKLQQDIAVVAFESSRADNRTAFNLPNAFIDQFEDATGIDTTSSTQHNSSEYVTATADVADPDTISIFSPSADDVSAQEVYDSTGTGAYLKKVNASYSQNDLVAAGPFSGNYSMIAHNVDNGGWKVQSSSIPSSYDITGDFTLEGWARRVGPRTASAHQYIFDWTDVNDTSRISFAFHQSSAYIGGSHSSGSGTGNTGETYFPLNTWVHWAYTRNGNTMRYYINGQRIVNEAASSQVQSSGFRWSSSASGELAFMQRHGSDATGYNNFTYLSEIRLSSVARYTDITSTAPTEKFSATIPQLQASGNFTGVTQTASDTVSAMSIVVMYEDNVGTATLNTDVIVQVSANNGTDWTTVTLQAAPNLSGTTKVAKSASIPVTAGTQPKYKILLANQASGTKITRIQGVSLLY